LGFLAEKFMKKLMIIFGLFFVVLTANAQNYEHIGNNQWMSKDGITVLDSNMYYRSINIVLDFWDEYVSYCSKQGFTPSFEGLISYLGDKANKNKDFLVKDYQRRKHESRNIDDEILLQD
jgi:hypothetical protein